MQHSAAGLSLLHLNACMKDADATEAGSSLTKFTKAYPKLALRSKSCGKYTKSYLTWAA